MRITSVNEETEEEYQITLQACTVVAACKGWKGELDGATLEILDCAAIRLLAGAAASFSFLAVTL